MEIREWSRMPEADKTVARCMEFFTEAYENRMEETLQGALTANAATNTKTPEPVQQVATATPLMGKWDWYWTHGLCKHGGGNCQAPAPNHKHDATLDNPMGGSALIRFPGQGPRRPFGRQR